MVTYRVAFAAVLAASGLLAQPPARPQFEVASVKPSAPGAPTVCGGGPGSPDPTLFRCQNFTLVNYIVRAYQIGGLNIVAPDWMNSVRFDITAKVPEGVSKDQFYVMLQ